jgi:hypothetical protein
MLAKAKGYFLPGFCCVLELAESGEGHLLMAFVWRSEAKDTPLERMC